MTDRSEALARIATHGLHLPAELVSILAPPDGATTAEAAAAVHPRIDAIVDDLTAAWAPAIIAAMEQP